MRASRSTTSERHAVRIRNRQHTVALDGHCRGVKQATQHKDTAWGGDCISSIRVAAGWHATIYKDDSFRGQSVETTSDLPNLQVVAGSCHDDGLNDCVSSIRVRRQ